MGCKSNQLTLIWLLNYSCLIVSLGLMGLAADIAIAADEKQLAFFNEYIQPILEEHCFECHSHAAGDASGGLVLDSKAGWSVGGDSGPAIVPNEANKSLLFRAVGHKIDGLEMPPDGKLSDDQLSLIEKWINAGAYDPRTDGKAASRRTIDLAEGRKWWAFQPVNRDIDRSATIDSFIERKLLENGITAAPRAKPAVLLRRLSYDLTGLPPSLHQLNPESDYTAAVDQLLESPQFGEKWGRHWLDLARYADSNGSSFNPPFRRAWRYRNWVIDAFNNDLPINKFLRKQIAGDLLHYESQAERNENLIATGFLMLGSKVLGTFDKEQLTLDVVDEQIDTLTKSMLGLTVSCARCHDHKFDPIPQADYYALAGFFTSTVTLDDRLGGPKEDESDWSRRGLGTGNDEKLRQFIKDKGYTWIKATQKNFHGRRNLERLEKQFANEEDAEERTKLQQKIEKERQTLNEWTEKLAELQQEMPEYAMAVRDSEHPDDVALRIRGVAASHGEIIPRGFLQVACQDNPRPVIEQGQSGRRHLADWIASDDNPLTARVFVNRVWKHLFNEGIVRSVDNFGVMGEQPSHPELLDHLTLKFIHRGWKLKTLVREIVLSEAYQRSISHIYDDPENRLFSHQNRRRLEPEELRDTLLHLEGQLDLSPGMGMIDHLPIGDVSNLGDAIAISDHRRTVYQPVIRTLEPTVLQVFDAPVNTMVTGARARTIVAPQALYLLNSEAIHRTCRALAARLWDESDAGTREAARIDHVATKCFLQIVERQPRPNEMKVLAEYLRQQADGEPGLSHHDVMKLCQMIIASTQFQFLD